MVLLFNRLSLEDHQKLEHYKMEDGAEVEIRMLRDIGVFDYHVNTPCHKMLEDSSLKTEAQEIHALIETLRGDQDAEFSTMELQADDKAKMLIEFADRTYKESVEKQMSQEDLDDLKINLTKEELVQLIGEELCAKLESIFVEKPTEIIIRRCQAHGKMINFHTDVSYKTLQMSLNSDKDYEGGNLVYATREQLAQPRRSQGTVTVHSNNIVHGVTLFKSGVRYGLFFLKK